MGGVLLAAPEIKACLNDDAGRWFLLPLAAGAILLVLAFGYALDPKTGDGPIGRGAVATFVVGLLLLATGGFGGSFAQQCGYWTPEQIRDAEVRS